MRGRGFSLFLVYLEEHAQAKLFSFLCQVPGAKVYFVEGANQPVL
jgi:hypothetical protein